MVGCEHIAVPLKKRIVKFTAVIPARYAATRFPAKLLQPLHRHPVIVHTYLNTVATGLFDEVLVVTDSSEIGTVVQEVGGNVVYSQKTHESGTERIAEIAGQLQTDVLVNVQGDEPFVQREPLAALCAAFADPAVQIASLMHELPAADAADPNAVKVVCNLAGDALYFSRSPIPYVRDAGAPAVYYKHIGVYAYRKEVLLQLATLPPTPLEQTEKLEQLRWLQHGYRIRMLLTAPWSISIDTPADLEKAKTFIK